MTRKGFFTTMAATAAGPLLLAQEKARVPARAARIRDVEVYPHSIPLKVAIKIALPTLPRADNTFVRIRTEEGVTGVGESSPYSPVTGETQQTGIALARDLAELVRGRDPFTISKIVDDWDLLAPGNGSIKAAFEMALWDICGKIAGQPVSCLLGRYRDSFDTDKTIFIEEPADMAEAARAVVRDGFRTVKVKVGESPDMDTARLRAVREAVGGAIALRIDANQGWSPSEAIETLRAIEKYRIQACEQPVAYWDMVGLKQVRDHSSIPIMADESVHSPHDAIELVRRDAVDLINIKLMKTGGILNAVRIAQVAAAAGIRCMLGCMVESSLALTAAAHVIASQKNAIYADLDSFLVHSINPIVGGMRIDRGIVSCPSTPGLGADIDAAFLKTLKRA